MWLSPEIRLYGMVPPLSLATSPQLRIPRVPKRITEGVEAPDRQADRQVGEDREPRRLLHEGAAGARQHPAPRRRRRLGADADEGERRRGQVRIAESDIGGEKGMCRHSGQDV